MDRRQVAGSMGMRHASGILMEGDIAAVMQPILDLPVLAFQAQQARGMGLRAGQTGQSVADFVFRAHHLPFAQEGKGVLQAEELGEIGPIDFTGQQTDRGQNALLDASMAFVGLVEGLVVEQIGIGQWKRKEHGDLLIS